MQSPSILILAVLGLLMAGACHVRAQKKQGMIDLLNGLDVSTNTVSGEWTMTPRGLKVAAKQSSRIGLISDVPANYDLTMEFTRHSGRDAVAVIIPVGTRSPVVELSGWGGASHGISRIDGLSTREPQNPTSVRPGTLKNGQRHTLEVSVRTKGTAAFIAANLNGRNLFEWTGSTSLLQKNVNLRISDPGTLGLGAHYCEVEFHRVQLQISGLKALPSGGLPAPPKPAPKAAGKIEFSALGKEGTPGWELSEKTAFRVTSAGGRTVAESVRGESRGNRLAYLKGVGFSEGTIEVDLKGTSRFQGGSLGVAINGVTDRTYDVVFFRPFNFGADDETRRAHAVQYMSVPEWSWNRLRNQRPGKFETRADPEPDKAGWFRARIVVRDRRVRVFINEGPRPSLDIELLSDLEGGKVGLWFNGAASFANLKITPAVD